MDPLYKNTFQYILKAMDMNTIILQVRIQVEVLHCRLIKTFTLIISWNYIVKHIFICIQNNDRSIWQFGAELEVSVIIPFKITIFLFDDLNISKTSPVYSFDNHNFFINRIMKNLMIEIEWRLSPQCFQHRIA